MKTLRVSLILTALFFLSAAPLSAQKGQVTCKDGTTSAGGRGACSGHGGIAPAPAKVAKTETKAATKVAKTETKAATKVAKTEAKAEAKVAKAEKKTAMNAEEQNPVGAIAECKDHTYSHAKGHRGACSRHGGVAKFLDAKR